MLVDSIPFGYCQCGCGGLAPIAKKTNRRRGWVKGQPLKYIRFHQKSVPIEDRFWPKVDRTGICWLWKAGFFKTGYAKFRVNDRNFHAHRVAYWLAHGPDSIPDGMFVLHNCPGGNDRKDCVNPAHLWLGTHADNMADMVAKGRSLSGDRNPSRVHPEHMRRGNQHPARLHPERMAHGDRHGRAKLTEQAVREIRESNLTTQKLAEKYGVSPLTIRRARSGQMWKHVP